MADVDYEETSHAEISVGPPKYRIAVPKSTRLALGLHNLDDGEKVLLDAEFSVKKVVSEGGDGSE
jgi:bifunctional DNA-binding transcriptional regulator/antitoxin component of YhaV-PrlF toxin-antitoxin module